MKPKMTYNREDDVLMIWVAEGLKVDHAEHVGDSILHVSEQDEPILLEVLNARNFIAELVLTALEVPPAEAAA